MRISDATPEDIWNVAVSMRDSDFREFSAVYAGQTREELADALTERFAGRPEIIAVSVGQEAIVIGAVLELRPNVGTLLFYATDELPRVAFGLTRFLKQNLFPRLKDAGLHRLECVSIDGHTDAHRWIEALGLKREGEPLLGYGRNKETFHAFSWVSDACKVGA